LASRVARGVPIVCPDLFDPVAEGFSKSYRPDANVTGITWQSLDSIAKRLQLARELLPGLRRVAALFDASDAGSRIEMRELESLAKQLALSTTIAQVKDAAELPVVFDRFRKSRAELLIVAANPLMYKMRGDILRRAQAGRIPVVSEIPPFAAAGAVLTYGPNVGDTFKRGAYFVDRILKGARVAELPIEQPRVFELTVNSRSAKALGITIPPHVLQVATRVFQ